MREFQRPLVICNNCQAKIYWPPALPEHYDADTISSKEKEPPNVFENCPRCGSQVDTRKAYPAISNFPLCFSVLKGCYSGLMMPFTMQRASLESFVHEIMEKSGIAGLSGKLNETGGPDFLKQQLFHRSCKSFYRSLQLFFAFLILERRCFLSWAKVTAYYSRFYFLQSFLNLALGTWCELDKVFILFDGTRAVCLRQRDLTTSPTLKVARSHEVWWQFMEAMKRPDYPVEELDFILSRMIFNPAERNLTNYDFRRQYGGFIELDWFDLSASQMLSQLSPWPRQDVDFTDIDRYFVGRDPENCDAADFYSDEAQILWHSLSGYLELAMALEIRQDFLCSEKIAILAAIHLGC